MAGLTGDQRFSYLPGRLLGYTVICFYNVAGTVANIALIASFGPTAAFPLKVAIALSIVAVAVISILPAKSIFDELVALRADRIAELEGSKFTANLDQSPLGLFTALTIGFNVMIAAVQIWALFSV
jgi:hypothetical protein